MSAVRASDGAVVVTGASGYVGSHVVGALVRRGHTVRACVTDPTNESKTRHLQAIGDAGPGSVTIHRGNLLEEGSYDDALAGAAGLVHVGTAMGYGGKNSPQQVYDATRRGTENVLGSATRCGEVRRVVYTSSFAAIGHPAKPGYEFTEADWCSDNRDGDQNWNLDDLDEKGETGYALAKEATEKYLYAAAEADGSFDAVSINPLVVLGPLLSEAHELVYSWQWFLGRMLEGKECQRGWEHLWNIVDVRDVGDAHALALQSERAGNGDRYLLSATDESGELDCMQLQTTLQSLFPHIEVGGAPEAINPILEKYGRVWDGPRAKCTKARAELGLETHPIEDTLAETGRTMIELGLISPVNRD